MTEGDAQGPLHPDIARRTLMTLAALGIATPWALSDVMAAQAAVPFPLYNPYTRFRAGDSWQAHRNRQPPSDGGQDYSFPKGTDVPAPAAGELTFGSDSGRGYYARIAHPQGWKSELLHFSAYVGAARTVRAGEIVGKSGGVPGEPGAGRTTGAHLHWSLIDPSNKNVDPLPQVNNGGTTPPPANPRRGRTMYLKYNTQGGGYLITERGYAGLTAQQFNLFNRLIGSDQSVGAVTASSDPFLQAELDIMVAVLRGIG